MGFAFPLFTTQMFDALGYRWGNTLFALVAVVLMPIPFVSLSADTRRIMLIDLAIDTTILGP